MKVIYRNAIFGDCNGIVDICKDNAFTSPSGAPPKMWWLKALIEKGTFIVAVSGDQIIGFAVMEEMLGGVGYFWMLGVDKGHREKGITTKLVQEIEKVARKKDLRAIICYGLDTISLNKLMKSFRYVKGNKYDEYLKFI